MASYDSLRTAEVTSFLRALVAIIATPFEMEKPQIRSPQVEGLKNFLVQLPYHFADYEIKSLSSSMEFRRIAQAIKYCSNQDQQKGSGGGNKSASQAAEQYNYSCIARTICPSVSKQFIQCWRQAQVNPGLTCETQRRGVETCVGEHVSQAMYAIDAGSLSSACFDPPLEESWIFTQVVLWSSYLSKLMWNIFLSSSVAYRIVLDLSTLSNTQSHPNEERPLLLWLWLVGNVVRCETSFL